MKMIVLSIFVLKSISALAAPAISEFERGFKEGKTSCTSEYWSCSATCRYTGYARDNNNQPIDGDFPTSGEGFSRGQALDELAKYSDRGPGTNNCRKFVLSGQAVCKKL